MEVRDAQHGVKIAKALFAERFTDQVMVEEGIKTINVWEKIKVRSAEKKRVEVKTKIDTGAWQTSIDQNLAKELGLLKPGNILWKKIYKSGLGKEERKVIDLTFWLAGRRIKTIANVAEREHLRSPMIIGRRDLVGFLVKPRK